MAWSRPSPGRPSVFYSEGMNKLISHFFPASNTQRFDDVLNREAPVFVSAPALAGKVLGKTYAREFQVCSHSSVQDRVDITFDSYNLMESGNCARLPLCPLDLARLNLRLT